MDNVYQFTLSEFNKQHPQLSGPRMRDFYRWLYKGKCSSFVDSGSFKSLISMYSIKLPIIKHQQLSSDGTIKFLIMFDDEQTVETVLIPFKNKYSVCLSTQVGCGMNCQFCHTATQGLGRNLNSFEIVGQYLIASNWLRDNKKEIIASPNIVFMGQGEPLHNFDELSKAIEIFQQPYGLSLGPRQICVSTVGYLPGLLRFSQLPKCNIAFSLHATTDSIRNKIIPVNKTWPLNDLIKAFENIKFGNGQFLNIEYLVIKDLNHTFEDAVRLKERFSHLPITVNLIAFNPFPGSYLQRPNRCQVEQFANDLRSQGIFTTIRTTKGDDILAACGQLKSELSSHKVN